MRAPRTGHKLYFQMAEDRLLLYFICEVSTLEDCHTMNTRSTVNMSSVRHQKPLLTVAY